MARKLAILSVIVGVVLLGVLMYAGVIPAIVQGPSPGDLLMALGRRDVWPRHDLALAAAMREVKRLRAVPTLDRQLDVSESWRPWRAVAARILWHHYLSTPRRRRS